MPKIIAELRETILQHARVMLLDGSCDTLTMRSIASACGVAVGTVYNYFPSKEMLLASVMLQDWQTALSCMHERTAQAASPLEGLRCINLEIIGFWDLYRDTWQWYAQSGHTAPLYGAYRQELVHQLEEVIQPLLARFHCPHEPALPGFLAETLLFSAREGEARFTELAPILSRLVKA